MTPFTTQVKAKIQAQVLAQATAARAPLTGAQLIAAERRRQITEEGWTAASDDEFTSGELVLAAAAYALAAIDDLTDEVSPSLVRRLWPWSADWWKPKGPVQNLVRAAALLAAEIDRVLRHNEDRDLRHGGEADAWKAAGIKNRTRRLAEDEEEVLP